MQLVHAQVIGMITAETERQARAAAKAVLVKYEDLPSIVSIQEAMAAGSFFEVRVCRDFVSWQRCFRLPGLEQACIHNHALTSMTIFMSDTEMSIQLHDSTHCAGACL